MLRLFNLPEINQYISGYSGEESNISQTLWGLDHTYLGRTAKDRNITSAYIVLTTEKRFQIGTFGLAGGATGPPGALRLNSIDLLRNTTVIPSRSFGYTAGSANHLASSSADFEIDSTVPQLWLPEEACALFEKAFGLIWDDSLKLYLVNDTMRGRLLAENPVVQFTLVSGEISVNYTFPYSAFNLRLTFPFVNSTTYYFPLKRASASARNMLGRTFLQETYVTVDYERLNFSLNQAYPDGGAAQIIPISSPSEETPAPAPPPSPPSNKSKGLSTAAYAGIGVGAGILALLALCSIIAWKKRLGPFRRKTAPEKDHYTKSELHGDHKPWVEAMEKERAELDAASGTQEAMVMETSELETVENARELKGSGEVGVAEVQDSNLVHELPGHTDDIRVAGEGTRTSL
ncbi:uncharacterized protein J4E88_007342 [Alternaria novae-zelandiae]|uniref:uncharacterized protein n=1 Tax=Alternaria novae-zelandiae TaxID=430562 RepID=UPI0020C34CD9|nr:uncharacterized protein J4E88_007342 [Alternaria novae-zelandiae]KAI4676424.1 hypothetical protein J4E88_007342 [Alternaria novae-zelandiae]